MTSLARKAFRHVEPDQQQSEHCKNAISRQAVAEASRYIVYKLDNGAYGYIGGTSGLSFIDDNITADLADTPQTARNPFSGAGNYPRCATFAEQRLCFGGTPFCPYHFVISAQAKCASKPIKQQQ
jgi:hypothetical protein